MKKPFPAVSLVFFLMPVSVLAQNAFDGKWKIDMGIIRPATRPRPH